jgi:hypothetical protein
MNNTKKIESKKGEKSGLMSPILLGNFGMLDLIELMLKRKKR